LKELWKKGDKIEISFTMPIMVEWREKVIQIKLLCLEALSIGL
jgi:hypothetical protein